MQSSDPFWALSAEGDSTALVEEDGRAHSYAELAAASDRAAARFPDGAAGRSLGFILFSGTIGSVAAYLGCLRSRRAVPLLLQEGMNEALLERLLAVYEPDWILTSDAPLMPPGYREAGNVEGARLLVRVAPAERAPIHPDLALLLSTSGSTGSEKLVRLSYAALQANAAAIIDYLAIGPGERTITTLPLGYSFGMSILNSHLGAGGSLVLTGRSLMTKEFWTLAQQTRITSLSGVPSTFEMLARLGLEKRGLASLRTLTQAGGALRPEMIRRFHALSEANGWRMVVMYGQTEASPRISYVPPDRLGGKIGSIGIAIPGGQLTVDAETSELIYRGPNVMMGYAECAADLARDDECHGLLHTGDLARVDEDGYFYLTGRAKRFLKLSGARVNLDVVEARLAEAFGTQIVCTGTDDQLRVWLLDGADVAQGDVQRKLRELFDIYAGMVAVERLPCYPLTSNGKIDYRALQAQGPASES